MDAADQYEAGSEDLVAEPGVELSPAAERLETALGGEFSRFLVTALASAQAPSRGEPR